MEVRLIKEHELPKLLPLLEQLGYSTNIEKLENRFKRFVSNSKYGIAVYEVDDNLLGFVAWSSSYLIVSDAIRIRIEALIVDRNYRNKGIGKQLMYFVEKLAQQLSPCIIDLTSGLRRAKDGTHQFYELLGLKTKVRWQSSI